MKWIRFFKVYWSLRVLGHLFYGDYCRKPWEIIDHFNEFTGRGYEIIHRPTNKVIFRWGRKTSLTTLGGDCGFSQIFIKNVK